MRVEPRPEQQLRPVDVADPAHDGLIHEQEPDRGRLLAHGGRETVLGLLTVVEQGVGALLRHDGGDALGVEHLAHHRASKVGHRVLGQQPQPHLADRLGWEALRALALRLSKGLGLGHAQAGTARRADAVQGVLVLARGGAWGEGHFRPSRAPSADDRLGRRAHHRALLVGLPHPAVRGCRGRVGRDVAREVPGAVHAEVHAEPEAALEAEEHLLADGPRLRHHEAVEFGGALGEAPLRRARLDAVADEVPGELTRDAMDGVTLWHVSRPACPRSPRCPRTRRAGRSSWRAAPRRRTGSRGRRR